MLKGCSKLCQLFVTICGISSKAIVWPEKPGITEFSENHVYKDLKILDLFELRVFENDGTHTRTEGIKPHAK